MSSSNISRRALVAAVAIAPAIALPASADPANEAELIALGPELEAVIRDWLTQRRLERRVMEQIDAETERLTGIKAENAPDENYENPYWKVRSDVVQSFDDPAETDENSPWNDILDRAFPLARRIMSMRAATMAGLAIQARASSLENAEYWDLPEMLDDQSRSTMGLIQSLCGCTGVLPVSEEVPWKRHHSSPAIDARPGERGIMAQAVEALRG